MTRAVVIARLASWRGHLAFLKGVVLLCLMGPWTSGATTAASDVLRFCSSLDLASLTDPVCADEKDSPRLQRSGGTTGGSSRCEECRIRSSFSGE